jgi:[NiFe] hydrogenase diaphorase moiety small subunit
VTEGMAVESETEEVAEWRRSTVEMLMVEGNHFCMFCEKSGDCELQAVAYRLGIAAPRYPALWPKRRVDASHPDVLIDHNRCIFCARCVRTSREVDKKSVFGFVGRGVDKRLAVTTDGRLSESELEETDAAVDACPVGAILRKRSAYRSPIGTRAFDHEPIGTTVEARVDITIENGATT